MIYVIQIYFITGDVTRFELYNVYIIVFFASSDLTRWNSPIDNVCFRNNQDPGHVWERHVFILISPSITILILFQMQERSQPLVPNGH